MSISSSVFRQKQSSFSHDAEDIRQQNHILQQENSTLKKSLEELININTELTESIEQFNTSHADNFPHINQQQIQQLAHQVIELQQELDKERKQRIKQKSSVVLNNDANPVAQELLKVIQELTTERISIQGDYQKQFERIENELLNQKEEWLGISIAIEQKMIKFQGDYGKFIQDMKRYEGVITGMEKELYEKNNKMMINRKEMKISTTIEDLRQTLDRQIEEKNKIIKIYEGLLESMKIKLNERVS